MNPLWWTLSWLLSVPVFAAKLGDPAPPLKISEWVKGGVIDLSAGPDQTLYVVEFWATWCPPCRASVPHLTQLDKKYRDRNVVILGISDENSSTVKSFVNKMGDKMSYAVAVDDDRQTGAAYLDAFGVEGIPHAFIVDQERRVIWHGHPMGDLDGTLDAILAGSYDLNNAQKRAEFRALLQEFFLLAVSDDDPARADELAKRLRALDSELGGVAGERFDADAVRRAARFQSLMESYHEMLREEADPEREAGLVARIKQVAPRDFDFERFRHSVLFRTTYDRYLREVAGRGSKGRIAELAELLKNTKCSEPTVLNDVAWDMLTNEHLRERNLGLALHLAKAANEAAKGKDANILDTYARALFDSGNTIDAIRQQKKAVESAAEEEQREVFSNTLRQYQQISP